MNCSESQDRIHHLLDQRMDIGVDEELSAHCFTCIECQELVEDFAIFNSSNLFVSTWSEPSESSEFEWEKRDSILHHSIVETNLNLSQQPTRNIRRSRRTNLPYFATVCAILFFMVATGYLLSDKLAEPVYQADLSDTIESYDQSTLNSGNSIDLASSLHASDSNASLAENSNARVSKMDPSINITEYLDVSVTLAQFDLSQFDARKIPVVRPLASSVNRSIEDLFGSVAKLPTDKEQMESLQKAKQDRRAVQSLLNAWTNIFS